MSGDDFGLLLGKRIDAIRQTLTKKALEYADGKDRLYNFKVTAQLLRSNPAEVCLGFLAKHLTSIIDLVREYPLGPLADSLIDEKIGDAICYLILLEAIFKETEPQR